MGRPVIWAIVLAAGFIAPGCNKDSGPDLSNPKAAAVTFTQALEAGDLATARMASNASGLEGDLLEAMAESSSGMTRLTAAAGAKLGEEAKKLAEQHAAISMTKVLTDGQVDQQGDRATVKAKGSGSVQLQRTDGRWRVDIGALTKGQDVSRVVVFLRAAGLAARQVADDIDAGRVTTLDQAQDVMLGRVAANLPQRLRERMIRRRPATTTTAPLNT